MPGSVPIRDVREIARWDAETDVLVVGLGCAGAAAALEARAAGARVQVLERASAGGGTSALSGGLLYLGGGTPVQTDCGFEDSPEQMFAYLMAACGPGSDEAKVRVFCEESVAHFHWLVEQGVPFRHSFYPHTGIEPPTDDGLIFSGSENAHPYRELAAPAPRGHCPAHPYQAGGLLMQKLLAAVGASGAEVRPDARCTALVQARDGVVAGVVARIEGREKALRARSGVVLAAGGFIMNDAMVARHAPWLLRCKVRIGCDGDDGAGIRLGAAAGGETLHMDAASISLPFYPPSPLKQGLLVDARGQRFVNEDAYYGRAGELALLQRDGQAFLVVDDSFYERPMAGMRIAAAGETIAEIEAELGMPAGALQETVSYYNRNAEKGQDPLFQKDSAYLTPLVHPPFGALDCRVDHAIYAAFTLGGLRTRPDGAVLDADDAPVPGLFAAGRTTSGVSARGYSSGISLADGTLFGRRAGRSAART